MRKRIYYFISSVCFASLLVSCTTAPLYNQTATTEQESVTGPSEKAQALLEEGRSLTEEWKLDEARTPLLEAFSLYAALDDRSGTVEALLNLGWNAWQSGNPSAAEVYYAHARDLAEAGDDKSIILDVRNHQADLTLRLGDAVGARELLGTEPDISWASARTVSAWYRLEGSALDALGETSAAIDILKTGVGVAAESGEFNEEAQGSYRIATMLSRQADFTGALVWAERALRADKMAAYPPGIAADLRALAIIHEKMDNLEAAEDCYRRAWLAWYGAGRYSDAESARKALETISGGKAYLPR